MGRSSILNGLDVNRKDFLRSDPTNQSQKVCSLFNRDLWKCYLRRRFDPLHPIPILNPFLQPLKILSVKHPVNFSFFLQRLKRFRCRARELYFVHAHVSFVKKELESPRTWKSAAKRGFYSDMNKTIVALPQNFRTSTYGLRRFNI